MTEGKQDRESITTGTTVIAAPDAIDADEVQTRGDDARPGHDSPRRANQPPPGFRKHLREVARAHPGAWAAMFILLLLLLVAAGAGTGLAVWAFREEKQEQKVEHKAEAVSQKAEDEAEKYKGKFHQAESSWKAALQELQNVRQQEEQERHSDEETKAILDFLKTRLLSARRPGDGALTDAFWAGGVAKDITLRKAVDAAESQVAEMFADRPGGEATVREMLGQAYLSVGEPARAVQQYERALALREATQGDNHPETAACRNQLAVAYRLAGRTAEASRLFDLSPNSPDHASALAVRGSLLLLQKKPAEAELNLRECLTIRRKMQPDNWTTFDTMSTLGDALLDQKKFADAEPMLLSGYEGLKQREDAIPSQDKPRLIPALERIVKLYEAWGKTEKAMTWRKELELAKATRKS